MKYETAIDSTELSEVFAVKVSKLAIVSISSEFSCNIDEEFELERIRSGWNDYGS